MEDNQPTSPPDPPSSTPPPSTPPPSAPPPSEPPASSSGSGNKTLMLVLSYFGILALIPLLVEKDDADVQWHAKHGLILAATWIVLSIVLTILAGVPGIGWILSCTVGPLLWLAILVVHIICIMKAVKGDKFRLPVVSDFADQWK